MCCAVAVVLPSYMVEQEMRLVQLHADAALVLNQEGDICRADGDEAASHEDREVRQLVKRVVLQRQQDADDEDSDFSD